MPFKVDADTVAKFSVLNSITGEYITYDLQKELEINEYQLEDQMMEHASKYALWSSYSVVAERYERACETELEVAEANADSLAREQLKARGIPKPTVGQVNAEIALNEDVYAAKTKLSEAKGYASSLKYILKALDQRKDMLVNLSAQHRKSMELTGQGYRAN